jgi:hypothetical protein
MFVTKYGNAKEIFQMSDARLGQGPALNLLTATEMAARLSRGETTSVAIVESCFARIEER